MRSPVGNIGTYQRTEQGDPTVRSIGELDTILCIVHGESMYQGRQVFRGANLGFVGRMVAM